MQTPPGWYRDPTNPTLERWWDGTAWSQSVRAMPHAFGTTAPHATTSPNAGASRTRTIAAVAGVVVLLVALIVTVAVLRDGGTDPSFPAAESSDPAPVPSGGSDFIDNNGTYSIHIGDDWDQATFDAGVAWYTGTGDHEFRDNVVIIVEDLPAKMSLDAYADAGIRSASLQGVDFEEQRRSHVVLSDGTDGLVIDSFSEQQGFELAHRLVVAVHDRVAVTLTFTCERDRFDTSVTAVDAYLRTLSVR